MKEVCIVEFPSNLGLKEPHPGIEPGVRKMPGWLRKHRFHELIDPKTIYIVAAPPYSMHFDTASGVRNAAAIASYAVEQAELLSVIMRSNQFPLVLGGDCSILIGNALALKQLGNYGLFYLDGHTDFMRPALSSTGGAAGMDLSIVTGHGHASLTNINDQVPYFLEENVYCVGNREFDPEYVAEIRSSSIEYIDLNELRSTGLTAVSTAFLEMTRAKGLDGFWLHVDVDILDPIYMPAVDSPDPGGLNYAEFAELLVPLLKDDGLIGLELTILDPDLDKEGIHTATFVKEFCAIFNESRNK